MSRALGMCASKAMCAKTTSISTEQIKAAISVFLEQLDLRKHQELALCSIECNDAFGICLLEAASLSVTRCSQLPSTLYTIELTPL